MKFKFKYWSITALAIPLLLYSCQSIQTSFGCFQKNTNREALLTVVGYHDNGLFEAKKFVSFKNIDSIENIQIHIKADSVKLSKQFQKNYNYKNVQIDSLSKFKKPVIVLSVVDKQDLIQVLNAQVDLNARPNLEVITEVLIKYSPEWNEILEADSQFYQFNKRSLSYEISYYKNDVEKIAVLKTSDILGYKSLYLCCKDEFGEILIKNLSDDGCPKNTFKTLNQNIKPENYERL